MSAADLQPQDQVQTATVAPGCGVNGIDISRWQPASTDEVNMDGCEFVGIRATYGMQPDPLYAAHEANARRHGAVVLAYCFGRYLDAVSQAQALVSAAPRADLYVLDLEADGAGPSMTASQASAFLAAMRGLTAKRTGLYHSASGFPSGLGEQFRWVAQWGATPPAYPWAFWQRRGAPLDLDCFNGTVADLRGMAALPTPSADPAKSWSITVARGAPVEYPQVAEPSPGAFRVVPHTTVSKVYTGRPVPFPCSRPVYDAAARTTLVYVPSGLYRHWVHAVGAGISVKENS